MELLVVVVEKVAEKILVSVGRGVGYFLCYRRYIKEVEEQLKTLEDTRARVESLVNVARSNAYEIYVDVLTWMTKVDAELLPQQNEDGSDSNFSCLKLLRCHPIKTKKRLDVILKLINDGHKIIDEDNVGHPAPLPSTTCSTLQSDYQILESRTLLVEKIKDALADPNVNKIGICGMGGVGKTKLLNEVKKLVLENELFHRVIEVTVGTSKDVMEIQYQIGGMLNIEFNVNSTELRASLLHTKLVEMKNNILIVLDDLWKEYDLEKEIGIPCRSEYRKEGCKILLTSRSRDLLTNQMNTDQWFEVNSLSREESWYFFKSIVGESIEEIGTKLIAENVVQQCGGLPIALEILGKVLKGKRVPVWKDTLRKLKKHAVVDIPGVSDKLYTCLKVSYDSIEDEAKLLLVMCSVFPDDHLIKVTDLQMYVMSMGLVNDISNWEDAKNRVIKLIDDLISSHLLIEATKLEEYYVQMHDVVRDVVKCIALQEDKMSTLSCGCGQSEWPEEDRRGSYNAIFVDYISAIGQLHKLEILRIRYGEIQKLPANMSQLKELKVLEVFHCPELEVIHPNTISSMTKLEELILWWSFKRWGEEVAYKNKLIKNVKLSELDGLTHLSNLRLVIPNVDILSNELSLERAGKLQEFCLWVGDEPNFNNNEHIAAFKGYATTLIISTNSEIASIGGVVEILLQGCERLHVKDSVALLKPHVNYSYPRLKHLEINENSDMPRCIEDMTPLFDDRVSFPRLMVLKIDIRKNFEVLLHNHVLSSNSFSKLREINIRHCNKFTCLFPPHVVRYFVFLEKLYVGQCELLETIFEIEVGTDDAKVLPLTNLELDSLPNLKYIWTKDPGELLTFPNLKDVDVFDCPQIKTVFPASFIKHMKEIESLLIQCGENEIFAEDEVSKLVIPEVVLFPSLRNLKIHCKLLKNSCWLRSESFPKLQKFNLFGSKDDGMASLPLEMSEVVYRIKKFRILNVHELVQVFKNGKENNPNGNGAKLIQLHLDGLPKLTQVWEDNTQMNMSFNSLRSIWVESCANLKCLLPSSITFSNLTFIKVLRCNGIVNLFSSSVTKNLVNLICLKIYRCRGMSSIVVEEETVEKLIFKRLVLLELYALPRLANFYSGKCNLMFPDLKSLIIKLCPEMKTFTCGIISTPKLPLVRIEGIGHTVLPAHDVNAIVQDSFEDEILKSIKYLFIPRGQLED